MIRVVYDGPPEAGKTTSLRALARSFGSQVYTPEEQDGRTVYFDWMEHVGGRFEGAPIHFHVASVPGQDRWLHRRLFFVERADALVFVGDTSSRGWPDTVKRLQDLRRRLDTREGPPVGVVFQANRRDAPDAVSIAMVREAVATPRIAVVESMALDGTGVREAFVLAVRLALDRMRELNPHVPMPRGRGRGDPDQALRFLKEMEAPEPESEPEGARGERSGALPRAPTPDVMSGMVWPPVEGRILLREATQIPAETQISPQGDFWAEFPNGWHAHSSAQASFAELDSGREALIDWARLHVSVQGLLSTHRCITLVETGDGCWRLWQVVRREPSLRELFGDGSEPATPRGAALSRASAGRRLAEAQAFCAAAEVALPCSLDTIGISDLDRPIFVGLVPHPMTLDAGQMTC